MGDDRGGGGTALDPTAGVTTDNLISIQNAIGDGRGGGVMTHDPAAVCTGRIRDCAIDDGRGRGVLTIDPAAPGSRAIRDDAVVDGRRGGVQVDPAAIDAGSGIAVPDGEALEPGVFGLICLHTQPPAGSLAVDHCDKRAVGGPDCYRLSIEVKTLVSCTRVSPVGHEHRVRVGGRIDRRLYSAIGAGDIMGAPGRGPGELIGAHVIPGPVRPRPPLYVVSDAGIGPSVDAGGPLRKTVIISSTEHRVGVDVARPRIPALNV